ncbi:hypothetical protein [Cupriavidus sp. 8B]
MRELTSAHGIPEDRVRQMMRKLARHGETFQVVPDLFYAPDAVRDLALLAAAEAHKKAGTVCAGTFHNATGFGQKRAIQVLESFDSVGYARFDRGRHLVRTDSHWLELL